MLYWRRQQLQLNTVLKESHRLKSGAVVLYVGKSLEKESLIMFRLDERSCIIPL